MKVDPVVLGKEQLFVGRGFRSEADNRRAPTRHQAGAQEDAGFATFSMKVDLRLDTPEINQLCNAEGCRELFPRTGELRGVDARDAVVNTANAEARIDVLAKATDDVNLAVPKRALKTADLTICVVDFVDVEVRKG